LSRPRLLFIAHRIPYPPNKGDKIRSYNELAFLSRHFEIDLVCFIDSKRDEVYLPKLQALCHSVTALQRGLVGQLFRLGMGALKGEALSVALYHKVQLQSRVLAVLKERQPDFIFVFSGQMAQYVPKEYLQKTVIDFCDVDSQKWADYAEKMPGYLSWFYATEAKRLLAFENASSLKARASIFITPSELKLYQDLGGRGNLAVFGNGVDAEFFRPFEEKTQSGRLLFTGAMDYFPNVEGVEWFAREVFVPLKRKWPHLEFIIAGANPTARVRRLAQVPGIVVTGFVKDMRAEQAKAQIVVVPLRIARGMQNKVLEALACGKAVVASEKSLGGIHAKDGQELEIANSPKEFQKKIESLLADPGRIETMGKTAREFIVTHYSWDSNLKNHLLPLLDPTASS
jgi:polysaccharide biosynthesis protein PslH